MTIFAIVVEYDSDEAVYPFDRVRLRDGAEEALREFVTIASSRGALTPSHQMYPPDPQKTSRKFEAELV